MSTSFAFVPRVVSKHAKPWQGISRHSPTPSTSPDDSTDSEPEDDDDDDDPASRKGKERGNSKQVLFAQDMASLVSLALSDYNIWLDADLGGKLDACLHDEQCSDSAGFVPINYILRRAPFRGSLPCLGSSHPEPSETEVVKALRTHAGHVLEVQMRLPSSSSVWYGTGKTSRKKDVGGYEVRRKDWTSLHDRPSRGWSRARWDDVTTYVEGIPPQHRTIGSIARFVEALLSTETDETLSVQNVALPPHYLDEPGEAPRCKGYALVALSSKPHVEALRRAWPWKRGPEREGTSQTAKEAHKYGLRTISKARWDALNDEYLRYKQFLIDSMTQSETSRHLHADMADDQAQEEVGDEVEDGSRERVTTTLSPYPFDCLVFVRNVHPETNKTTLKTLFGHAFQDGGAPSASTQARSGVVAGLDYVDFNKGMETCHLRLASPHHATRLVSYFAERVITQADGLDAMGRAPVENERPILMEMVQGKKEAVYWEKVPEKVRRQAVDKAVKAANVASPSPITNSSFSCGRKRRRE